MNDAHPETPISEPTLPVEAVDVTAAASGVNPATHRRRTVVALVVVHALTGAALCVVDYGNRADAIEVAAIALWASQAALLGLWLAFGMTRIALRGTACLLALVAVASCAFARVKLTWIFLDIEDLAIFFGMCALGPAVTGFLLRRTGWTIGLDWRSRVGETPIWMQFTLFDMFLFTTISALTLAAVSATGEFVENRAFVYGVALFAAATVGVIASAAWFALSTAAIYWRLLAVPVVLLVALATHPFENNWAFPLIMLEQWAIAVITLLVFRRSGYRFYVRQRPR